MQYQPDFQVFAVMVEGLPSGFAYREQDVAQRHVNALNKERSKTRAPSHGYARIAVLLLMKKVR